MTLRYSVALLLLLALLVSSSAVPGQTPAERDFKATLEHVLARTRPETDLYVFSNLSMDTLDYTGPKVNEGSKGVWLGLGEPVRELPREFRPPVAPPQALPRRGGPPGGSEPP